MAELKGNYSNLEIKTILNDVLQYAFPSNTHPLEKLQQFFVEYQRKEAKNAGDYNADLHRIRIFNLSRDSKEILLTALHDLSHHIEYTFYGESAHRERFYTYYHNVLVTAVGMKLLAKMDLNLISVKELEKLEKFHGPVVYWKIPEISYKDNIFYLDVKNGYEFRDVLKDWGYKYLSFEEVWRGEFNRDTVWEEKSELNELGIEDKSICVHHAVDFQTSFVYYLVIRNAYDHRLTLRKLGYKYGAYNVGKRNWVKKIDAKDLNEERAKVEGLMGVSLKVMKELPSSGSTK
ncbi:hypothetical protein QJV38_14090 [Listeria cossartiae subsp. cayugensis]|uniref:IrrE N-terminal-like domain-containing protein n=1 Tax=Listeria cossartiae subsp. cayugensis TaxID=2713505 RepID=A0ABU2IRI2_9LIST|nr:hypothetical protein [Listeria cossartiae]MDT0067306.1 hypothetical protein [Listeria cossartiae subsp. cayugensis]MDT0081153.1 hypothetical protein [Listeria cossartiae subsp. cayugensis]MDT0083989.1 hypothetical protein [Listeria cossartiae subsp. cayugensis]MDT0089543.1 hypothetical protein [Listeria cossartiae subsp. cayugensis]MDT0100613.1 hypothetical protein [Listeria cossartiae subsp. cayugensis]